MGAGLDQALPPPQINFDVDVNSPVSTRQSASVAPKHTATPEHTVTVEQQSTDTAELEQLQTFKDFQLEEMPQHQNEADQVSGSNEYSPPSSDEEEVEVPLQRSQRTRPARENWSEPPYSPLIIARLGFPARVVYLIQTTPIAVRRL